LSARLPPAAFAQEEIMFDAFVGLPWLDKGRDGAGVDCWGLLCLVFAELRGIELPSYAEAYVTSADRRALAALIAGNLDAWEEVPATTEQPFDGVLMREGRFVQHIGVVVKPGLMLHVERGSTSAIERYRSGMFAHRVVGFYRFKQAV
jgi:cell wall-associated NlpC family hydrolase